MYPELFRIGGFTVHSFGVMMALGFVAAGLVAAWQFKKRGIRPDLIYSLLTAAIIGGIVGSKINYLIIHPDQFRWAALSGSGLVWYGGLFGGLLACGLVAYFSKQSIPAIMDAGGPALAAGYAVGRLGCFLNGDDYGRATSLPWGMSFPEGDPPTMATVHPTQLYETLGSLAILAILLLVLSPRLHRPGALILSYLILAGIERFLVEFVRTNDPVFLGLTLPQWVSLGLMVVGAVGLWWVEFRRPSATGERLRPAVKGKASLE